MVLVVGLGVFAPGVETNLSGAGWQADGSESVAVRDLVQDHFGGSGSHAIQVVVHRTDEPLTEGDGPERPRRGHRTSWRRVRAFRRSFQPVPE